MKRDDKMFDKFKKDSGGEMTEDRTVDESTNVKPSSVSSETIQEIGIVELMSKRAKLEEAIDYVGLMIKNLKDKRTVLEKDIEEESVDIKNLKEKLEKVSQYIEEENRGIKELAHKRQQVENEADEVGSLINSLRDRLSGIDRIIDNEGTKVKKINFDPLACVEQSKQFDIGVFKKSSRMRDALVSYELLANAFLLFRPVTKWVF